MVNDPQRDGNQIEKAGSLLFFIVAILVLVAAAGLELLQRLPPLEVGSHALVFLLLAVLVFLTIRLRTRLR